MNFRDDYEDVPRLEPISNHRISIGNENHTLMNLLRYTINKKCEEVELCGYKIPHPSEDVAVFNIHFKCKENQNIDNIRRTMMCGLSAIEEMSETCLKQIENWDL